MSTFSRRQRFIMSGSCCIVALALAALLIVQSAPASSATSKPTAAQIRAGKTLFKAQGCGKCHTLAAARSHGTVGPNLNKLKLTMPQVVKQITDGGGFMPSFGATLSKTKITQVAAFVYSAMHKK